MNYHRRLFDVKVLFINMDMGTLCKPTSSLLVPPSPENRVFRLRSSKEESASCEEMALRTALIYVTSTGSHYLSSEIALIFLLYCSFVVVYDMYSLVG